MFEPIQFPSRPKLEAGKNVQMTSARCPMVVTRCRGQFFSGRIMAAGVSGVLVSLHMLIGSGVAAAESPTGGDAKPVGRQSDDTVDALQPAAFRMALSGDLDASAPTVPAPSSDAAPGRTWRDARPRVPQRSFGSSETVEMESFSTVLERSGDRGAFALSRSIAPLLTPPTLSMASPVTTTGQGGLPGMPVGTTTRAKPRTSLRFR